MIVNKMIKWPLVQLEMPVLTVDPSKEKQRYEFLRSKYKYCVDMGQIMRGLWGCFQQNQRLFIYIEGDYLHIDAVKFEDGD